MEMKKYFVAVLALFGIAGLAIAHAGLGNMIGGEQGQAQQNNAMATGEYHTAKEMQGNGWLGMMMGMGNEKMPGLHDKMHIAMMGMDFGAMGELHEQMESEMEESGMGENGCPMMGEGS